MDASTTPSASSSAPIASTSSAPPPGPAPPPAARQPPPFEFMKRKRWADLLISELSDAILLVLSADCRIMFCGRAVQELLGWKDEELVDGDLVELMNANDRESFRAAFADALGARRDMLAHARLRCKAEYLGAAGYSDAQREVLFEIAGYPHFSAPEDAACRCFFAVAKPYPSRNVAMLNTFLELKMDNVRLQERLRTLKELHAAQTAQAGAAVTAYGGGAGMGFEQGAQMLASGSGADPSGSSSYFALQGHGYGAGSYAAAVPVPAEEDGEDQQAKKKRKVYQTEQYVCNTCGRTNSPEWRKGPKGPKTLCNACGLRWAKKVRKFEEATEAGGEAAQSVLDGVVPP